MSNKFDFSRKEISGWGDSSENLGLKITFKSLPNKINPEIENIYSEKINKLISIIIAGLQLEEFHIHQKKFLIENQDNIDVDISINDLLKKRAFKFLSFLYEQEPFEDISNKIGEVADDLKEYIVCRFSDFLFKVFDKKINSLAYNYIKKLPSFIQSSERDDLISVAKIEFMQTIRAWSPLENPVVWPLAYSRINGAMKDYIRCLTKADPSRLYKWVTDAAYIYINMNKTSEEISGTIESKLSIMGALEHLNDMEKKIVTLRAFNDLTMTKIGLKIGLSESQVSRIYAAAIAKLKNILKND
jgi:RNA polymerase sigma factor (sigma-70 family)